MAKFVWTPFNKKKPRVCETVLWSDGDNIYFGWLRIRPNDTLFVADENLNIAECELTEPLKEKLRWKPLRKSSWDGEQE